jgi:hypothetical protein
MHQGNNRPLLAADKKNERRPYHVVVEIGKEQRTKWSNKPRCTASGWISFSMR